MYKVGDILREQYQLQLQLGRTATGHQTWLAIDLKSQEKVIIKLLAFSPQMQWEELKLFEREAQILQAIAHPRIPRYRDYFDIDKNVGMGLYWFALVQDYIPGSSLQELLEKGKRFTEKQIRAIATKILEILIYLHELNPPVLHRDIKPSNLILGKDGYIYLIDFGAVQARAAVTGVTFTIVGTGGYSPLEQFWGRAVPASDLYALGATLIHLLTGIAPIDLPQQDYRIQFSNRVNIQSDLLTWIERITDIAVDKRFSSSREALKVLSNSHIVPVAPRSQLASLHPKKTQLVVSNRIKIINNDGVTTIDVSQESLTDTARNSIVIVTTIVTTILIRIIISSTGSLFLLPATAIASLILFVIYYTTIKNRVIVLERDKMSLETQRNISENKTLIEYKQNIQKVSIDRDRSRKNNPFQICLETDSGVRTIEIDFTKEEAEQVAQVIQDWQSIYNFSNRE